MLSLSGIMLLGWHQEGYMGAPLCIFYAVYHVKDTHLRIQKFSVGCSEHAPVKERQESFSGVMHALLPTRGSAYTQGLR